MSLLNLLHHKVVEFASRYLGWPSGRTVKRSVRKSFYHDEDWSTHRLRRRARAAKLQDLAPQYEVDGSLFHTAARTEPCLDFNGDFYGVYEPAEGQVAFFLGDVSGKGLPAAFYQMSCQTLLRQCARADMSPAEVVTEVNDVLSQRSDDSRFATLVYGMLDTEEGRLTLVSAGHPMPLLVDEDGTIRGLECPVGLPVGLQSEVTYVQRSFRVREGDTLLFYSDGISEARDENRIFLGEEGLRGILQDNYFLPVCELVEHVMREVSRYSSRRQDDQTVLALRLDTATVSSNLVVDEMASGRLLNSAELACA